MNNFLDTARQTLQIEADTLEKTAVRLDETFLQAAEILYRTQGKVIVTGVGKSGLVGAKMAATFASTGTPSFFLHPTEALHGDLGMIGKEDCVLAISYSGESEELTKILPHLKRFEIALVALCSRRDSTLGRYADAFVDISVEREACPLGIAPTASTTLTMALGDALAAVLMQKRGFRKEDFASFHPGGSLGKRLFVKVKDLMRSEGLPIVESATPFKEALVAMSRGRLGHLLFADERGKLLAILSDGDLRRALLSENFDADRPAIEYATHEPKRISLEEELLAVDALRIMEKMQIQLMPIVDAKDRPVGVVHLHDLVEAGIGA